MWTEGLDGRDRTEDLEGAVSPWRVCLASAELGVALVTPRAPPWHVSLGPGPPTSGDREWGQGTTSRGEESRAGTGMGRFARWSVVSRQRREQ